MPPSRPERGANRGPGSGAATGREAGGGGGGASCTPRGPAEGPHAVPQPHPAAPAPPNRVGRLPSASPRPPSPAAAAPRREPPRPAPSPPGAARKEGQGLGAAGPSAASPRPGYRSGGRTRAPLPTRGGSEARCLGAGGRRGLCLSRGSLRCSLFPSATHGVSANHRAATARAAHRP